jgi:hypothetical protein
MPRADPRQGFYGECEGFSNRASFAKKHTLHPTAPAQERYWLPSMTAVSGTIAKYGTYRDSLCARRAGKRPDKTMIRNTNETPQTHFHEMASILLSP